ncbi:PAS domain S-box protein [candidate division KSB1 bacterium]|nr:PAS domain S-box protein [candidate division KSB1 bacterium]
MRLIPGYQIVQELHRGKRRIVYRARREHDDKPVIIKTALDDFPEAVDIAGLKREHEILQHLQIDGIARLYGLERQHDRLALILEDIGGEPLRSLIDSKEIDLTASLKIGIQLCNILATLHQNNIIHKELTPANIFVNLQTNQVQLIDFSVASRLPQESQKISHPNLLEGTLAYMSPEQTGRMNRAMDYRTDFYSLGVTFYEMLTGRLPFYSDDALELVHSHIAKIPTLPHEINLNVPRAVSDIVMKLLAKTAEDRYKSAFGLKADLEVCWAQWQARGKIEGLVPGLKDFSDRFQIPQKLYGREPEIAVLLSAFDRVAQGATEIMLVSGYSGIGKSALVNEVHKPIVRQRGYFITGKFDQFKRNIPYSAVIQAFQELVRQLLTENETQIVAWKDKLTQALGANGQIIIDVIPEVELIVGKQPALPELPPAESQNRFNLVFQRFIQVFTQKEHPLVIFLDDLQWADSATLKLLQVLTTDPNIHYLFLLGAYRDNEVSAAHPLTLTLAEIEKAGAKLNNITLAPLHLSHLNQFIADTLRCETEKSRPLSELVLQKTAGNPFFVTQFLKALHQEKLLEFDYRRGHWQFDLELIQRVGMTDNVVELMAGKIQRLANETQHVVKLAACIGNQFDLKTLAMVNEKALHQTANDLWEAVHEGLIIPIGNEYGLIHADEPNGAAVYYKFLHDRVQQAAYALIPDDRKKAVHLKIGQLLLANTNEFEREEKIFDIVNQLNHGLELLTEPQNRRELAALNLAAGKKAKSSTAYQAALGYHKTGINLLTEQHWEFDYDLLLALHIGAAECEYLCGNFAEAEAAFDHVLFKARTRLDKANVYNLKLLQYESMSRYHEAIRLGSEALALFGLAISEGTAQIQAALDIELDAINALIGERSIAALIDMPMMQDPEMRMVMKLLTNLHTSCFLSGDKPLTLLNTARMVHLSLAHGNSEESAYAYMLYASMHVVPVMEDYAAGYEFGLLAQRVNGRLHDPAIRAKVLMNFAWAVSLWRRPMAESIPIGREAFHLGNDTGMFVEAAYALFNDCWFALLSGSDLETCRRTCRANVDYTKRIKMHHFAVGAPQIILQWGLALQGLTESPTVLSDADFDEEAFRQNYQGQTLFEMFHFDAKLAILYTFEEYHAALEFAGKAERVIKDFGGTIWDALRVYYHALTLTALFTALPPEKRPEVETNLESCNARLRKWAENSPQNFKAQHLMVSAELCRVRGQDAEAMNLYEAAIAAAANQECPREGAQANELCAKFWLRRGQRQIAAVFMEEARRAYGQWGAHAKVRDLEQRYAALLSPARLDSTGQSRQATIQRGAEALDLQTVIKAAQAISSEMVLSRLLEKLMQIVIENAGAQKGILVLEKNGELTIAAEGVVGKREKKAKSLTNPNEEELIVLRSVPFESSRSLAKSIVNYVKRTGESLVVTDAASDGKFANDAYVIQNKPNSILCMPILHQGKLIGILYLENNLATGAFTPDRIEVMQILCTQTAISLENARLYEEMQQEIAERQRVEMEIRSSEEQFRALFENSIDAVLLATPDGNIIAANPEACRVFGRTEEEICQLGRTGLIDPADSRLPVLLQERERTGRFKGELSFKRKDGSVFPGEVSSAFYKDKSGAMKASVIIRDITERKRAEAELMKSEERFRTLFESAPIGISINNAEGKFLQVNRAFADMMGFGEDELRAMTFKEITFAEDLAESKEIFGELVQGQRAQFRIEKRYRQKNGGVIWANTVCSAVRDNEGRFMYTFAMVSDISERKRAEAELRKAHDELELRVEERTNELSEANKLLTREIEERLRMEEALRQAKDAAEAANRAKSEFLARMSHELRTPLNSILGYAQIFKRDKGLTEAQQEGIAIMHKSGEHLLGLINEVLDLSKIEAQQMELRVVAFNLPEFLNGLVEVFRERAEQKGLDFLYEALSPLPVAVRGDAQRLRQVLINLLGNAIKFTERGSVALKVGYHETLPNQTLIRFQVEDTGIGIAPEHWETIFHPFHQVSDDRHFIEGTGLGLTISRELVRMMGGELKLKSTPGQGSVFWVDLNLHEIPSGAVVGTIGERTILRYQGARRKILVVDDKPENRAVIVNLLAPLGFDLREAADGREGVSKATAWQPDLILMDLVMPEMDGFEATRRIRQTPTLQNVIVIALSASVFEHNRQQSLEAGCNDFIPKPLRAENLLEQLRMHLGLEWVYEKSEKGEKAKEDTAAVAPSLIGPPAAEAAALFDLAMMGDIKGILQRVESIEQLGDQFKPFAGELRRLAKEYRMKEIRELVRPFMQ